MQLRMDEYGDADEVEAFMTNKLDDLAPYDKVTDETRLSAAKPSRTVKR